MPKFQLTYRGHKYGPSFPTQEALAAFAKWVEARTGFAPTMQSAAVLERLKAEWEKRK